jgi:hypothetical protein
MAKNYKNRISEVVKELLIPTQPQSVIDAWRLLKQGVERVAERTLGKKTTERRQPWFDEECKKATQKKNAVYRKMQQRSRTRGAEDKYKQLRREEKHIHQKKKRNHYVEKLKQTEAMRENNKTRLFYRNINDIRNNFKPRNTMYRNKNGNLITDKEGILRRWI